MSSNAGMGSGNSETLGPKASNVATRWGTVKGGSTYESVSTSRTSVIMAAAGRRKGEVLDWVLAAKAISRVSVVYVSASGQVLFAVI